MDSSRNSSSHTNRTNRTKKFNEIQELDLMELLDLPKTLSNEAILRFYRFNNGDLFGDLRSIINAIVDKIKKKKIDENGLIGIEQDIPKSSGVDNKWNLVKRKFIKIAMLGNFFNCKTKINYYKSSDHQYEWLVFSITEIEFTRRLKILQMNSRPFLENTSTDKHDTNSFNNLDNSTNKQFTSNSFNQKNSSIINTPPKLPTPIDSSNPTENNNDFKVENINKLPNNNIISIIPNCTNSPKTPSLLSINLNNNAIPSFNSINQNSMSHNKISLNTYNSQIINPNAVNNPYHNSQANNPNAVNPYPSFPTFEKSYTDSKDKTLAKDFNKIPTIIYNNENSPKIQKIVISLENENEVDNLIIASEGTLEIEDLVHERTSYPVDTARKNLDSIIKGEASLPVSSKKKYGRLQTVNSTIKESKENLPCPSLGKNMAYGKTFETMNSSEFNQFNRKLLVPQISLEINPFLDFKKAVNINEGLPPVRNFNPMVHEEDEEKMADRIINFTGERLFEEKSEDLTDHSVKYSGTSPFNRRKSIMSSNLQKKKGIGFRARFNDGVVDEKSSDVKEIGTSFTEKSQKIDSENVNKEDLKIINKTLKDISKGILQGADSNEDDSDKKTIRSTKMANTLKTINSMNKKTNGNVNFTPKTHKLLDVLRETIVKKLALEENQDKKEKAYEQSVHSSISSIYQSNRLTEKAILNPFVPKCYKRLSWSLLFLMIAIFVMQISIYLIIVKLYEDFKDNLVENVNYNRFSNTLLQSIKNILVSDVTSSRNFDQEYYKTFLINSISQEFNELAISINNIQLNYEFYHGLSSNFFTRKTFYNISENVKNINNVENLAFTVFPYDLIKAVTLYLSEMQKFLNSETINLTILLQNLFGFAFEFSYHDNFNSQRNNLIKNNKLTILIILIMISTFIILIFLLRIISHLSCYNYMNDLLEMLAKINYEDIETLKTYYISIASVYDLQQEIKGPGQNGILGINYVENPGALKDNNNNKNRSHRMVDIKYLSIPNSQILFMNFIFCIFIIAINLIVVFLSHGFDNYFESSGNFQKHMLSQFNFKGYTTGYLLSYDHNLGLGIYNMSRNEILTYLNKNLPNETLDLGTYNSQNPFITHYLQVITSEQICRFLTLNTTVLNRCEGLLNGLMNKSLVNFELETAQLLKVMMLDGKKSDIANLAQFGEGLDYALNLTNLLKSQYISSEYNSYDSELKTLILINCFSIICAFIIILGYYVLSLRKLEERLISIRKIYLNIPIAILIRQKRIKKYLQDTSSFFLGG